MRSCLFRSDRLGPTGTDEPRWLWNYPQEGYQQLQTSTLGPLTARVETCQHKIGAQTNCLHGIKAPGWGQATTLFSHPTNIRRSTCVRSERTDKLHPPRHSYLSASRWELFFWRMFIPACSLFSVLIHTHAHLVLQCWLILHWERWGARQASKTLPPTLATSSARPTDNHFW